MFDCTTDRYATLYSRWLYDPGKLLRLAKWKPNESLLDLCGGTGIISNLAAETATKKITLIDKRIRKNNFYNPNIKIIEHDIGDVYNLFNLYIKQIYNEPHDVVVCRQAINYICLSPEWFRLIRLMTGQVFIFNTFKKPRWGIKNYLWNGKKFIELFGHFKNKVFHFQLSKDGIDFTTFHYYSKEKLLNLIGSTFETKIIEEGNSIYFICKK